MRIRLSFERQEGSGLCIMVDLLRASATITAALDQFREVIPVADIEEAVKYSRKGYPVAGERGGDDRPRLHSQFPN
jgi:Phosphosulfolactate phosphohydrolase and related enzymes